MAYNKTTNRSYHKELVYNRPKMFYSVKSLASAYSVALIDDKDQRYLAYATNSDQPTNLAGAKMINLNQLKELTNKYQFIGFNNRHYDDYMIMSVLAGKRPITVNRLSQRLISNDLPPFQWHIQPKSLYGTFDIESVLPKSTSLKQIASDAGLNIQETSVDPRLKRNLTKAEMTNLIADAFNDVVAIKQIFYNEEVFAKYRQHVNVINRYLAGADWAVSLKDASLAEQGLTKGRYYVPMKQKFTWMLNGHNVLNYIPDSWKTPLLEYAKAIEQGLVKYNEVINNQAMTPRVAGIKFLKSVPAPVLPELKIGDHLIFRPSLGGAHSKYVADDGSTFADHTDVHHRDVSGAYGQVALDTNLFGPVVTKTYYQFMKDKWAAKKTGDPEKIMPTKLMTNAPTGKCDQPGSKLYNPVGMIEARVMLQVVLYLAAQIVVNHGGQVFSINTDGLFYIGNEPEIKPDFDKLYQEWKISLDYDHIDRYIGKDDNSRVIIKNGKVVEASGEVIHQTFNPLKPTSVPRIIDHSVLTKLVHPELPMDAIVKGYAQQHDVSLFAMTIKADKNHRTVFNHLIGQKVNRVFLTTSGLEIGMYSVTKDKVENVRNLNPHSKVMLINQAIPNALPQNLDIQQYIDLAQSYYEHWHMS